MDEIVKISSTVVIYAMGAVIMTLGGYIAALIRLKWKDSKEEGKNKDSLLISMTEALTKSSIAIENNSKVVQQNTEVLNKVKYRRNEDFNSGG